MNNLKEIKEYWSDSGNLWYHVYLNEKNQYDGLYTSRYRKGYLMFNWYFKNNNMDGEQITYK